LPLAKAILSIVHLPVVDASTFPAKWSGDRKPFLNELQPLSRPISWKIMYERPGLAVWFMCQWS